MIKKLGFRAKVLILPVLAGSAFLVLSFITWVFTVRNVALLSRIEGGHVLALQASRDLEVELEAIQRALQDAASTGDRDLLEEADLHREKFQARLGQVSGSAALDAVEMAAISSMMANYYSLARSTSERMMEGQLDQEAVGSLQDLTRQYNALKDRLVEQTAGQRQAMAGAFATLRSNQAVSTRVVLGTAVVCILLLALLALWISHLVTRPVVALTQVAEEIAVEDLRRFSEEATRMARGDLTRVVTFPEHPIGDDSAQDELGRMARSFKLMVSRLREIGDAFNLVTEGLRGIVVQVQNAGDQVATGSQEVARSTAAAAGGNRSTVEAVEAIISTIHEMSASIVNVTSSTQSQASSSTQMLASIENMARSLEGVARAADRLAALAERADESVAEGRRSMNATSDGMSQIRDAIFGSAKATAALGTMAQNIGSILRVIEEIAEQTNLLALNAAIEAARAGDHGLGFAVVAEEVRKLAERSGTATEEITAVIRGMRDRVDDVVANMEGSTAMVDQGIERTRALESNLREMADAVSQVTEGSSEIRGATAEQSAGAQQIQEATARLSDLTHEIRAATEEQSSGADSVVAHIEHIRSMVQANADGANQLAELASTLEQQATLLRQSIARFQTAENEALFEKDVGAQTGDAVSQPVVDGRSSLGADLREPSGGYEPGRVG